MKAVLKLYHIKNQKHKIPAFPSLGGVDLKKFLQDFIVPFNLLLNSIFQTRHTEKQRSKCIHQIQEAEL